MTELTTQLIKTFRQILYRDSYYVICGALISVYTERLIFEQNPSLIMNIKGFWLFVFVGLSLAIGLVNQELWSQVGVVTTSINHKTYPWICEVMYERHTRIPWHDRNPDRRKNISGAWDKELWSRIIDLKQIGSSLSACNLSLAAITSWAYFHDRAGPSLVILHTVGFLAFASVCWVKTMQQAEAELEKVEVKVP